MQEIKAESLLSCHSLWNTLLIRCRSVLPALREAAAVREGNPMTAPRSVICLPLSFCCLSLWFIFGNNNMMVAQELENRGHIASESEAIPQTLASLSHDANDTPIRQIEGSTAYAVPVRLVNDNVDVPGREKLPNGCDVGARSYRNKYVLGETGKCDGSGIANDLGAESQPSGVQIPELWGNERTLHRLTDGNINAFIHDATMELKPFNLGPCGVRNVNYREAVCARSFVFIPFETFTNYVSSGDEAPFVIHEETSSHNLLNADVASIVGPRSARDRNDGFFYFLGGIYKPIHLGLSVSETEDAEKADEAAFPHTGDIVVHSLISDNCHLSESGDLVTLTCDDLTIPQSTKRDQSNQPPSQE
jgi:hypothetical protein